MFYVLLYPNSFNPSVPSDITSGIRMSSFVDVSIWTNQKHLTENVTGRNHMIRHVQITQWMFWHSKKLQECKESTLH
jgi:hypothetical protein